MTIEQGEGWEMRFGRNADVLPTFADGAFDHAIQDPPYSPHVHAKSRGGAERTAAKRHCIREHEFGFEPLDHATRRAVSIHLSRLVRRWSLTFTDLESVHLWRRGLEAVGLEPVRVALWIKEACTPQFTGDRPAVAAEGIVIAHRPGRKRWSGGGKRGLYSHAIVGRGAHNSGPDGKNERVHTAQKPIALMEELVRDFTDPGETVLDPFAGSGTTGVACLRLGRRFIGIEKDPKYFELACERLRAEEQGSTLSAARAGQTPLFTSDMIAGVQLRSVAGGSKTKRKGIPEAARPPLAGTEEKA